MPRMKPLIYSIHTELPDICVGRGVEDYIRSLRNHFGRRLARVEPETPLPNAPVYYLDSPRNSHREPNLLQGVNFAVRRGVGWVNESCPKAQRSLAGMIARKIVTNKEYRENLVAYGRVPNEWYELFKPELSGKKLPGITTLTKMLLALEDDIPTLPMHPLSHMLKDFSPRKPVPFSDAEKLKFLAENYMGTHGGKHLNYAVEVGSGARSTEYNLTEWLVDSGAYRLETVGDMIKLRNSFTPAKKIDKDNLPNLPVFQPET